MGAAVIGGTGTGTGTGTGDISVGVGETAGPGAKT